VSLPDASIFQDCERDIGMTAASVKQAAVKRMMPRSIARL
jgi:hypothetical protein